VRGLDFISVTDSDLDDTAYESAERPFVGNMNAATRELEKYLKQFLTVNMQGMVVIESPLSRKRYPY
jgi:pectin methylesterase-like acyl-CoA thioesterase